MTDYDIWKKAVVHLECATDSEKAIKAKQDDEKMMRKVTNGELSWEEYSNVIRSLGRDERSYGTALYVTQNQNRYLLTARHVLHDALGAKHHLEESKSYMPVRLEESPTHTDQNDEDYIFEIIFRVPSFEEKRASAAKSPTFLMNLGAGVPNQRPYTFSNPAIDLAIISLDQSSIFSEFGDDLDRNGFRPIDTAKVFDGPMHEGEQITSIGYLHAVAVVEKLKKSPAEANWSSELLSLPVLSFGRVSMLTPFLPFFWGDISIYGGNSGGPVVTNDGLIGIVSEQATIPVEKVPGVKVRIPFAKITKAKYVRELLDIQIQKDRIASKKP